MATSIGASTGASIGASIGASEDALTRYSKFVDWKEAAVESIDRGIISYADLETLHPLFESIRTKYEDFREVITALWTGLLMHQCKAVGIPNIPDSAIVNLKRVVEALREAFSTIGAEAKDMMAFFLMRTVCMFCIDTDDAFYALRTALEDLCDMPDMLLATHAVVQGRHIEKLPMSAVAAAVVAKCGWHDNNSRKSQVCVMNVVMCLPEKAALHVIENAVNIMTEVGAHNFNIFMFLEQVFATMPKALKFIDIVKIKEQTWGRVFHTYIKRLDELRSEQQKMLRRLEVVQMLGTAWRRCKGRPEKSPKRCGDAESANLTRTLSLRRFCRIRGVGELDMETEVVEPFAREIALFL
jgi:hypothetical protein